MLPVAFNVQKCAPVVVVQVVLQHLNRRSGRRGFNPRFTSATLCNILLALAVSCPSAATPALLTRLWRVWHSRVLPVTDATQAAAVAWAVKWLGVQPPAFFVSGLLQQLQVTAADSQLQHIAAVLLQARQGNWLVDDQQVQQLLQTVLHKHSTELLVAQGHVRHQRQQCQHVFLESAVYQQAMWQQQCTGNSCVVGSSDTVSLQRRESAGGASSSDRQSGSCGAELATIHALNTPEHKGWLTAAAALQAWHEILERPQLQHAVELCAASARLLPHEHQQLAQLHTQTLSAVMYQNQQNQETMINRKQRTQGAAEAMAILKQQNRVLRESSAVVSSVVA